MIKEKNNNKQSIFSRKEELLDKLAKDIAEAREDVKAGRVYSAEDVYKELGLK